MDDYTRRHNAGMEMFSNAFVTSISAGYERDKKILNAVVAVMGAIENGLNEKIKNTTDKTAPTLWESFQ